MLPIDGFWLPRAVRERVLGPSTAYATASFAQGRPCLPDDLPPGAVTARWPLLAQAQWSELLAALRAGRRQAPTGQEFWQRLQLALGGVARRLADPADPLHRQALGALPGYTGYSEAMIRLALSAMDLVALEQMPQAMSFSPTRAATRGWQRMPGLPGRLRCYPLGGFWAAAARLAGGRDGPLLSTPMPPELVVGYGAGNVPGTALLIALLAQSSTLAGGPPPAVLVRNSRREPIFSQLVLSGIEATDPDLLASVAVLVWDYDEAPLQRFLLSQAGLVIAAASDETIARLGGALREAGPRPPRLHAHGHKVSFSAIAREALDADPDRLRESATGRPWVEVVALLAAFDSVFWDQNGCLSSRVHFVEIGDGSLGPDRYAAELVAQLRLVGRFLPRGAWPRSQLADRFDRYKLLETGGRVRVASEYEDEFVVVVDERPLDASGFRSSVNDCQGRVIIVRPVADLADVPGHYLRLLPAASLQSLSIAAGRPGESLPDRLLTFAEECGAAGVTAIRTVGRGAFPQLAYSWDGLIPLDLVHHSAGRWTSIEFDVPYDQMLATYQVFSQRGARLEQA